MQQTNRNAILLLCFWLSYGFTAAVITPGHHLDRVHDSTSSSKSTTKRHAEGSRGRTSNEKSQRKPWSSMLTVDPAKILSHLVNRGGLVLPRDAAKQFEVARQCMAVDQAELNVLSRELNLYNFTIGLDSTLPALRVAKAQVKWDSYLRPTLDILVEDVSVQVEFTNLLLTENNWNDIRAAGFPPSVLMDRDGAEKSSSSSKPPKAAPNEHLDDAAFVRFHNIDLKGTCTVRVTSRPLGNKEIGTMTLDFKELRGLSKEIQALSDRNLQRIGRAGCSPDELSRVIQQFFDRKIRLFIQRRVEELSKDPKAALRQAEDVVIRAGDSVVGYVKDAGLLKSNELQQAATERLKHWGIPNPTTAFAAIKERALYGVQKINVTAVRDHVNKEAASVIESLDQMRDSLKNLDQREDETEFVFADW
ncbi:hypothetical protein MPSEU_001097600 [Mayamaea pseudoterrestris]|nr:hypothetical protein MPSEU_001097600 [Mayamaea pseudoterrestris]